MISTPPHYGTKPGQFDTLKIHFPTCEGVSEVSERANERTDERVAQCLRLYSWLIWPTVHQPASDSNNICFFFGLKQHHSFRCSWILHSDCIQFVLSDMKIALNKVVVFCKKRPGRIDKCVRFGFVCNHIVLCFG